MEVLFYTVIFLIGLSVSFACVSTDNPSHMFDVGFAAGLLTTISAFIMILSFSWPDVFDCISLLFQ